MSNSSESSCDSMYSSESVCSEESSCYLTANSGDSEPEFSPFDDTIEPLASAEEIVDYEESIRLYAQGVVSANVLYCLEIPWERGTIQNACENVTVCM